jgi:hypothetical protein
LTNIQNKIEDLIADLTNNLETLDSLSLQKTEELVLQLCNYNTDVIKEINTSYYRDLFLNIRKQRGYKNYDKIKLSNNSIGLFRLKRNMSFNKSYGLTGACKDVVIELAKRNEDSYEVRLLNYPYDNIPKINNAVQKIITKKQIEYYCKPLDEKNEN